MNRVIARDRSRKLQHELAALLDREIKLAAVVLPPSEVATILLEAGVMMVRTVAASIASQVENPADVGQIFDRTVEAIAEVALSSRADSVAVVIGARKRAS